MNFQELKKSPAVFQIMVAFCFIIVLYMVFAFFHRLQYSQDTVRSVIQLVLWMTVTIGFVMTKKWAWIIMAVLMSFSVLSLVHVLVSRTMPFHVLSLFSIAISILLILGLNMKSVRDLFQADSRKGRQVAVEATNFAIFCTALGLFVFIGILSGRQIMINPTPVNLFIGFIGFTFILLGISIWRLNTYAVQAVLPFLAFTIISIAIVLIYDMMGKTRFSELSNSVFYIIVSIAMLVYWAKWVRPKLP